MTNKETLMEQMKRYEMEQLHQREYERQMAMSQINTPGGYPGSWGNNPLYPSTNQAHTHTLNYPTSVSAPPRQTAVNAVTVYSLAEVQLTGGRMIAMTISAGPTIGKHLIETMKNTGYLHLFNESETLMIRAAEVVAVKVTKLTTE